MEKMNMQTKNKAKENFEKLVELFPNAITESIVGQDMEGENIIERSIDADILRQEISEYVIEGKEERYQFTWPDKKKSMILANTPINATLRPIYEDSINFDTTENLYIEGDNLDVLKLLQETYLGKIKMIYIDPPYNTGNDFIYEDDFTRNIDEYKEISGDYDEDGNRLVKNTDSNGRFHTDWLNMIYPRLKLARDLLSNDGVIFISIANQEIDNMKKVCEEIFGMTNFVGIIDWESKTKCQNTKTAKYQLQNKQEYVLVYKKKSDRYEFILETVEQRSYPNSDDKGYFRYEQVGEMSASGIRGRSTMTFPILDVLPREGNQWKFGKETVEKFNERNDLVRMEDKVYFKMRKDDEEAKMAPFWSFISKEIGTAETAKSELKEIIGKHDFETVKPVNLIKKLIFHTSHQNDNDIILDFFSGSATTAHAVMELNAEDRGNRKFIMVQLPEETDEKSESYKSGYKNICEIGKERIRRAAKKIREGNPDAKFDDGFRVLKLDSSNMKDVYYKPHEIEQNLLDLLESNIKEDRISEDLLFQVMLDLGVLLSSPIVERTIEGKKVYSVAEGFLMACFDKDISDEVVKSIAIEEPYYAVFKDSSMKDDSTMSNFDQIFETYSPATIRKVL